MDQLWNSQGLKIANYYLINSSCYPTPLCFGRSVNSMKAHHIMSVPAEPVPEWCWRSSNFQHLLISWTCHFLWQTRRSLLGLGRHVHIGGVGWQVSHNLLLSDLGPSTHEEPTLEQPPVPLGSVLVLCLHWLGQVIAQITGQWTSVLDLCCWNIPQQHPELQLYKSV